MARIVQAVRAGGEKPVLLPEGGLFAVPAGAALPLVPSSTQRESGTTVPQALAQREYAPPSAADPADFTAAELLAAYRAKRLSPVEAMQAVLARVERCEPKIRALYALDPERALAEARASEARWAKHKVLPLDGVPATIKDNVATKGTPVPLGTAARPLEPAPEDAPPAARLREAGAVVFAKTTMPDYGMLSSGLSSFHPLTCNPWDLAKNPGGSSAGAGAAAAAGYGPLHLGTDIGGSIRLPAGWCGVFGLKPSLGRVPIDPPYYGRVAGPMTRTVTDAALMMRELSRSDDRDVMSLPPQEIPWLDLDLPRPMRTLRIGLLLDAGIGMPVEEEVEAAVLRAAKRFQNRGAKLDAVEPFLTRDMMAGLDRFWRQRAWADISALPPERQDKVLPYIRTWAEGGSRLSGRKVYDGMSQMLAIKTAAIAATKRFDYVLSPVAPVPAFPAELASPLDDPARPFEHIAFTVPFNFSEQPAASINAGYTAAGLPIGLQIVGRRFDDLGVMRMARAFEDMRGPQRAWPTF
ncbi:MAG TPA: amidase [Beijerinckiaceae bacterium]